MVRVIYNAPFQGMSGYSKAARLYLKALDLFIQANPNVLELRVGGIYQFEAINACTPDEIDLLNKYLFEDAQEQAAWIKAANYVLICHSVPTAIYTSEQNRPYLDNAKAVVSMTVWETTALPKEWVACTKEVDAFIVPCTWNVQVFGDDTKKPVHYLPHVLEEPVYDTTTHLGDPKGAIFKVLAVSQWTYRKGFDVLIRAFAATFHGAKDARLYIKAYRSDTSEKEQKAVLTDIRHYKHSMAIEGSLRSDADIVFIGDALSDQEMHNLYSGCNLFALASRGEGFGLPYSEAIMHGKPVLCPTLGGHLDYIDTKANYMVDSHYDTCHSLGQYYDRNMDWVEPHINSTVLALKQAYIDWKHGKLEERGRLAKAFAKEQGMDMQTIGTRLAGIIGAVHAKQ